MNTLITFFLFLLLTHFAQADLLVEMQIEDPISAATGPTTMTTKTKGPLSRIETSHKVPNALVSTIVNSEKGEVVTLDHSTKTFTREIFKVQKTKPTESPQSETGKEVPVMSEKVGEWDADVYELTKNGEQQRVWVVKAFPNADAIKAELAKEKVDVDALDAGKFYLGGMIVKLEVHHKGGKFIFTLLKASVEPVADSEFVIPEGYKETKP